MSIILVKHILNKLLQTSTPTLPNEKELTKKCFQIFASRKRPTASIWHRHVGRTSICYEAGQTSRQTGIVCSAIPPFSTCYNSTTIISFRNRVLKLLVALHFHISAPRKLYCQIFKFPFFWLVFVYHPILASFFFGVSFFHKQYIHLLQQANNKNWIFFFFKSI